MICLYIFKPFPLNFLYSPINYDLLNLAHAIKLNYNYFPAVLMSEIVKMITCLAVVYVQTGGIVQLTETINIVIVKHPMDTLKVCVPSFVYVVQNNLLYVSASHLDAATYQVRFNLKYFFISKALFVP